MNKIDPEITVFLSSHFVLSLATSKNNKPYSANCYYLFNEDNHELIFSSDIKAAVTKNERQGSRQSGT